MKKKSSFAALPFALPFALAALALGGCSNTVRYLTPMQWLNPSVAGAAAGAAPAEGRTLYVTYWEGSCMPKILPFFGGCSLGDSKIRRCNLKPDNQMECVDEVEATQAFSRKK
jgi:hypothetical protein